MTEQRKFTGLEARQLLRRARTGTLATLNQDDGAPYASLVNVATCIEGQPLILISSLAWHTRNLDADPRASLLVAEPPEAGDALTGSRATVMGQFSRVADPALRRRYLARHPEAALYAGFGDFAFWQMQPVRAHAVAGFGRIETIEGSEVFLSARQMVDLEAGAVAHMNEDHGEAIQAYATHLVGSPQTNWKIAAIDPDGADLVKDTAVLRLSFGEPVLTAAALRKQLASLAQRFRNDV